MSATLLILILISGWAVAFFLRFLAALHTESRSLPTHYVTMRSGGRMESAAEHGSFDRRANAIVRLEYRINDSRTLQDQFSSRPAFPTESSNPARRDLWLILF